MSVFTTMHTTVAEEVLIPQLVIHTFHQAFESVHSAWEYQFSIIVGNPNCSTENHSI